MYIITQSCVLFLWLHSLTFVKSEDCTLANFINGNRYDRNFDTSGLESSYPPGKQVRVGCNVGYTGFFRLVCLEDGKWSYKGTNCQRKSCGHPGDAQFADFELVGDDFVFGSQVVYTCHKGYQMVSRKNILHCMENGWDGVIPVCEAQHCPVITVNNNVQVIGDPEEATYGNVLRFGCRSSNEALIGSQEIYCNERGQWSEEVPTCGEVRCSPPVIENGYVVGDIQVYKQHEFLEYKCNRHYKPTEERLPTCTKIGIRAEWSPTPACEQVTCKLSLPATEGTSYDPPYRNVFSPGETLRVICGEKYWISRPQDTSAEITCRNNGKWSLTPTCNKLICLNPRDRYLRDWDTYWGQQITLGDTVRYSCKSGFKRTDGVTKATCTREGWKPDPFCQAITCLRHDIQNANIVRIKDEYRFGEQVNYVCKDGYEGSFALTCREDGWAGNSYCREVRCDRKHYSNAEIIGRAKSSYKYNEQVEYLCQNGYEGRFSITCGQNGWIGSPQCREVTCEEIHYPDAEIIGKTKSSYKFNEQVEYACKEGYDGRFSITCGQNGWTGSPQCREVTCPQKRYQNAETIGGAKSSYKYNEQVEYVCKDGFEGRFSITCGQNGWIGSQECREESSCGKLPVIPNMKVTSGRDDYEKGASVQIICEEGYTAQIETLTCLEGKWNYDAESLKDICAPNVRPCGLPPKVENAIVETSPQKEYASGSDVTYRCRDHYTIKGDATITCNNGSWGEVTTACTPDNPCGPPPDVENADIVTSAQKEYSSGSEVTYSCRDNYTGRGQATITCTNGRWSGRREFSCSHAVCSKLPDVPHANVSEESAKAEYQQGDVIYFTCQIGYISGPAIKYACTSEGWLAINPGRCYLKPCGLPDDTPHGYYEITHGQDFVYGTTIKYFCNEGYHMVSKVDTRDCMGGKWTNHVPICDSSSCDHPPTNENITVDGLPENDDPILPDQTLRFSCDLPGKTLNGNPVLRCGTDGKWNYPFPSCDDKTCKFGVMPPHLNAAGFPQANETMKVGDVLKFHCDDQYILEGSKEIHCLQSGDWNAPFPTCTEKCKVTRIPENVNVYTQAAGNQLTKGQKLKFSCRLRGHILRGSKEVECLENGRWSHPFPTCGTSGCGRPPPLADGDIIGIPKSEYRLNERVKYSCQAYYIMQGEPFKTCQNGEWTGEMRCLKPCTVDREMMNIHNIAFRYTHEDKLYSTHGDAIQFACTRGRPVGTVGMRQTCNDGVMELPSCQ
ncbi:complement factor H isoform X12 [Trachinotus anak]|uniref:complement factor H isoform X12 n=1 Tax=Trachinotus anak TaxID=443729 RepID=UPI0039F1CFF4